MKILDRILELAAELAIPFEGLHLEPYRDPVGYPTIGYGHLLSRDRSRPLSDWPAIDQARAEELLELDLRRALRAVRNLITYPLSDSRQAALVDFTFNLGSGNLQVSTLRRVINRGELAAAPGQFLRWVYADGLKLPGLVRRRQAEVDLWNSEVVSIDWREAA